jgi:CRISPR-associated exonuclease Cas4
MNLLPFILTCLLLGLFLLWQSRKTQRSTGLPVGEVVYSDTGAWQKVENPLLSRRFGLVGRPDYLVQVTERGRMVTVPVEVKSRKRPATLLAEHVLQLATYCLLVEDQYKTTPPYGLLRYADATLKIPYTDDLRTQVLNVADAIRGGRSAPDVPRSHNEAERCRRCGYRAGCGQELRIDR